MVKEDCIFCKISNKKIEVDPIYEDDDVIAIFDAYPANDGHILVMPKKHIENIYGMDEDISKKIFATVVKLAKKLEKELSLSGLNIVQNNGELAGQTVKHFHIHLIPRNENDEINISWKTRDMNKEKTDEIRKRIR